MVCTTIFIITLVSLVGDFVKASDKSEVSKLSAEVQELKALVMKYGSVVDSLSSELQETKRQIATLQKHPKSEKRQLVSRQIAIAFHVQLTKDIPRLGDHQTINFDLVKLNAGNGYNKVDGIFRAPVAGVYVFSWVTTNKDRSFMNTELVVDGVLYGKAMADAMDHNDYAVATNVVVVSLTEGAEVWIRSGTWHNGHIGGDQYSTFSGWLLYQTERYI